MDFLFINKCTGIDYFLKIGKIFGLQHLLKLLYQILSDVQVGQLLISRKSFIKSNYLNNNTFTTFFLKCNIFMLGTSRPDSDLTLFSERYSSVSSGRPAKPAKLRILFLLNYSFLSLGCPPKFYIFSILF